MKKNIHPKYDTIKVQCSCGNMFETRSTVVARLQPDESLRVEICSVCHPFYTGEQRLVDTTGRVDKFKQRFAKFGQAQTGSES